MDLSRHLSITSAHDIAKIVEPLSEQLKIKHFRYLKLYHDGSRIVLSDYPDCTRFFYQEGHYKAMWYDGEFPEYLTEGWKYWDVMRSLASGREISPLEREINTLLGLYHGMTFVSKGISFYEIYTFDSGYSDVYQIDTTLLNRFMHYFKEQASHIIRKAENEKLKVSTKQQINTIDIHSKHNKVSEFLNKISIKRYYLSGKYDGVYLTTKEIECAYWLLQGKSADEIAIIINNSYKTVTSHIDNIRKKLNCSKQTQIVRILLEAKLLENVSL